VERTGLLRHTASVIVVTLALAWFAAGSPCAAADTYVAAAADSAVGLRIQRANGRAVVIPLDSAQVEYDRIAISKDGRSVGWLALYPNCCTSYPIPLKLVVYSRGRARTFDGTGLPVWRWHFAAAGRQVAFKQETVHGGFGVHYELRDIATGRLIAQYDPPAAEGHGPPSNQGVPRWVAELDASR